MSAPACTEKSGNMRTPKLQDDSICTDEFEIINCDNIGDGPATNKDDELSYWSTKHSINVESTIPMNNLADFLCSAHSVIPSMVSSAAFQTLSQVAQDGSVAADKQNDLTSTADVKNHETSILAGTVNSLTSIGDSTLAEEAFSITNSDDALENVVRTQSETREILEKAIMSLDSLNKERSEFASKFATLNILEEEMTDLKNRIADLEKENASLKLSHSFDSKSASISCIESEVADLKNRIADLEKENATLKQLRQNEQIVVRQSSEKGSVNDDEVASLKQQVVILENQIYDRGLEVDMRTKSLTEATNELEAAYRKIADLTAAYNTATQRCKELRDELDETFAKLVAERERVSVVEDEIRSIRAAGGEGFNLSLVNRQMVDREMQEKAAYAQKLESELEETTKQLKTAVKRCDEKESELRTHLEIINLLKEDDVEGRRQLVEKDRKIKELEAMVHEMCLDRAEVNNC